MSVDLIAVLPKILPKAINWAEAESENILLTGVALGKTGLQFAKAVGVTKPELIRVSIVKTIPLPDDEELRNVALQTGLLGPKTVGLTLGYGIYICYGYATNRLISHECRHVYQYEIAGSIGKFLPVYLKQIATIGYYDSPLEIDARKHECNDA